MKIIIKIKNKEKYKAKNGVLKFLKPSVEKDLIQFLKKNFNKNWEYEIK